MEDTLAHPQLLANKAVLRGYPDLKALINGVQTEPKAMVKNGSDCSNEDAF